MRPLDLQWQRSEVSSDLDEAISAVLSRGDFIQGAATRAFEEDFAEYIGSGFCVGCGNGTDALELILESLGIGQGDEVIVPAMTFVATSEAVMRVGAHPVLVDVDEAVVIDTDATIAAITDRTRAVIAVHLYGFPVDVEGVQVALAAAGRTDVLVIEDAAQAHGASLRGRKAGSLGAAAAFSFYPGKNLGAFGDAGAVTTSDAELADRVRRIANHGRLGKFDHQLAGRNSRMDSLQGAILAVKLRRLDAWVGRRRAIADRYLAAWSGLEWLRLPSVPRDGLHAWHQFAVLPPERAPFAAHLHAREVPTGVHYPQSLAEMPFHKAAPGDFPQAVAVAAREVSIPIGEHLSDAEVDQVIEAVAAFTP